jgi:translation initiation factor IF-1
MPSDEPFMSKDDLIQLQGEVVHVGKGGNFRVQCENGHEVLAKLSGHTRRHRIRVVLGDRVTVAVSPYDPSRGFIVYRER